MAGLGINAANGAKGADKNRAALQSIKQAINDNIFKKLGVDGTISVTNTILEHVEQEIPAHPLIHLLTMSGQIEEVVELLITKESPSLGKSIGQIRLPADTTIALVIREGARPRIPDADTVLKENDRVIALTTLDSEKILEKLLLI